LFFCHKLVNKRLSKLVKLSCCRMHASFRRKLHWIRLRFFGWLWLPLPWQLSATEWEGERNGDDRVLILFSFIDRRCTSEGPLTRGHQHGNRTSLIGPTVMLIRRAGAVCNPFSLQCIISLLLHVRAWKWRARWRTRCFREFRGSFTAVDSEPSSRDAASGFSLWRRTVFICRRGGGACNHVIDDVVNGARLLSWLTSEKADKHRQTDRESERRATKRFTARPRGDWKRGTGKRGTKSQGWKRQDWKTQDQISGVENARPPSMER